MRDNACQELQTVDIIETIEGRPYVRIKLFGEEKMGLLDSGASITLKRLCPLMVERRAEFSKETISVTTANGGQLEALGSLNIPFEFNKRKFRRMGIRSKTAQQRNEFMASSVEDDAKIKGGGVCNVYWEVRSCHLQLSRMTKEESLQFEQSHRVDTNLIFSFFL